MRVKGLFILGFAFLSVSFVQKPNSKTSIEFFLREYQKDFHPKEDFTTLIFVSIKQQKLYYLSKGFIVKEYFVSTSKFGIGCQIHSKKTPFGLHKVQGKIGNGTPLNGIIQSGVFSGTIAPTVFEAKSLPTDFVTTRVLRLMGLESGVNAGSRVDTYKRAIYIHGTPEEGLIGKPASHGCVRLKNADVLELYNKVPNGALVLILNI